MDTMYLSMLQECQDGYFYSFYLACFFGILTLGVLIVFIKLIKKDREVIYECKMGPGDKGCGSCRLPVVPPVAGVEQVQGINQKTK